MTAVVATAQRQLALELGADAVIDYTTGDFTLTPGGFDFVFDAVGKTSYLRCRKLLGERGVFAASDLGSGWQNPLLAGWYAARGRRRVLFALPGNPVAAVNMLAEHLAAGGFRAVIDRVYPLADIQHAYRYVATGSKVGVVVIDVP